MPVLSRGLMDTTVLSKNRAPGAEGLLWNEPLGLAIDATTEGGTVYVRDTTAANNRYNEPLNGWFGSAGLLTNGGTSPKLCQWNDGTLHWSAHNLALQSQTFDNAAWTATAITVTANDTAAPDGTTTAEKAVETNTSTSLLQETASVAVVSGFIYTVSIYVKDSTAGWVFLNFTDVAAGTNGVGKYFDLTNVALGTTTTAGTGWSHVTSSITDVGNGWRRLVLAVSVGAATSWISIRSASADNSTTRVASGTYWLWGAQRNRGMLATAYLATTAAAKYGIPQQYDVTTNQFGILSEPAATNNCLHSEEANNNWGTSFVAQATISADATTAPDGSSTADKLVEDSTSNEHLRAYSPTFSAGNLATFSIYVKAAGRNYAAVQILDGSVSRKRTTALVDLTNGTLLTTRTLNAPSNSGSGVTSVGNGWYRVYVTETLTSVTSGTYLQVLPSDSSSPTWSASDTPTYAGDGSSGIYIWGAQCELGAVATTYIPTVAATVTRAADNINCATSSFPFGEGTLYSAFKVTTLDTSVTEDLLSIDDGTTTNRYLLYKRASTGNYRYFVAVTGTQVDDENHAINGLGEHQLTVMLQTNNFGISRDGDSPTVDTSGTVPTVTTLRLGNDTSVGYVANFRKIICIPRNVGVGILPGWRWRL